MACLVPPLFCHISMLEQSALAEEIQADNNNRSLLLSSVDSNDTGVSLSLEEILVSPTTEAVGSPKNLDKGHVNLTFEFPDNHDVSEVQLHLSDSQAIHSGSRRDSNHSATPTPETLGRSKLTKSETSQSSDTPTTTPSVAIGEYKRATPARNMANDQDTCKSENVLPGSNGKDLQDPKAKMQARSNFLASDTSDSNHWTHVQKCQQTFSVGAEDFLSSGGSVGEGDVEWVGYDNYGYPLHPAVSQRPSSSYDYGGTDGSLAGGQSVVSGKSGQPANKSIQGSNVSQAGSSYRNLFFHRVDSGDILYQFKVSDNIQPIISPILLFASFFAEEASKDHR